MKEMDDLGALWQKAKTSNQSAANPNLNELIKLAQAKKKSALAAHYGNAAVLGVTVIMLVFYFHYLYNFQDVLSKVGIDLMIYGLVVRIAIELYSAWRSRKLNVADTAAQSLQHSVDFHEFRKRIHGPITIVIFVLYFIGFYFLTPEFSRHISLGWLITMDVSALIVAAGLAFVIRRGIKQELRDLEKMIELQRSLTS